MTTILTIAFSNKRFDVALWVEGEIVRSVVCTDASKNLVADLDALIKPLKISDIDKISFLLGPGSFTSCRIACSVCLGIRAIFPHIIFIPTLIDEAVHKCLPGVAILMRCNSVFWHLYEDSWRLVTEEQLLLDPPAYVTSAHEIPIATVAWPDLSKCLYLRASSAAHCAMTAIEPFYGFDI